MNPEEHADFAEWDAAYVIGALSTTDRRAFEAHLESCALCRRAVAELSSTVGMLSRLSADDAQAVLAPGGFTDDALGEEAAVRAGLASMAQARTRRRRRSWWVAAAAAVVLVVGGIAVPVTIASMTAPTAAFALEEVGRVPLQATVRLTDVSWGTRIDMDCRYPDGYAGNVPVGGWTYALAVVDAAGDATTVSTWRAEPGTRARVSAGTATAVSGIRAIEIRSAAGAVLMRRDLPARSG